jgi:glutamate-1-semialdehyde 2,1-aminomutase
VKSENHHTGVAVKPYTFEKSEALMERAKKVVPGGIYGHQTPLVLTKGAYPSFFARGEGSHIWDVDGNEYIDYMCSYGPLVLGHRHPKVEEAARRQMDLGNCFNAPGPAWVELAEHLVSITPFADWTVNGVIETRCCFNHAVCRLDGVREKRLRRMHLGD